MRGVIADAQERAVAIVHDAEDEATRIRTRAESDARKRLDEISAAFEDLQGKLTGDSAEVPPGPVPVPEPIPEPTPDPVPEPVPTPPSVPEPSPPPDEADPPSPSISANGGEPSPDKAAARLVAMKMALDGAPREEIDAHLAQNYDVESRDKLLDDVLARAKA